jgi:hypothetical protein
MAVKVFKTIHNQATVKTSQREASSVARLVRSSFMSFSKSYCRTNNPNLKSNQDQTCLRKTNLPASDILKSL